MDSQESTRARSVTPTFVSWPTARFAPLGSPERTAPFPVLVRSSDAEQITALCVTTSSQTPGLLLDVRVAGNNYSFGDLYSVASAPAHASGSGIVNFGETLAEAGMDAGKFFNIWDVAIDAMQFVASSGASGKPSDPEAYDHLAIGPSG